MPLHPGDNVPSESKAILLACTAIGPQVGPSTRAVILGSLLPVPSVEQQLIGYQCNLNSCFCGWSLSDMFCSSMNCVLPTPLSAE
jgi:hypothetical protein